MNSYRKLPDGSWGINCDAPQNPGDVVTVTKRDGSTKTETLGDLVYAVGQTMVYAVVKKQITAGIRATAIRRDRMPRSGDRHPLPAKTCARFCVRGSSAVLV